MRTFWVHSHLIGSTRVQIAAVRILLFLKRIKGFEQYIHLLACTTKKRWTLGHILFPEL